VGLLVASKPSNYRRTIAAKKFSQQIVRRVIKPMVSVCPVNIPRLRVLNLQMAARNAWA
jgi:hypothetical protein